MDYRVQYESIGAGQPQKPERNRICGVIAVVLVCAAVMGAVIVKTVGLPWVETFLIPADPQVTENAWNALAEDLRSGERITDAVTAFCREIMANGT